MYETSLKRPLHSCSLLIFRLILVYPMSFKCLSSCPHLEPLMFSLVTESLISWCAWTFLELYDLLFVILNSMELVCPSHKYDIQNSSANYRALHCLFTMDNQYPIFFYCSRPIAITNILSYSNPNGSRQGWDPD